ncbi:small acid-soluble spore protein alpha/beta type [Paenibacillus sp. TCA20]|uniref:alpha/beta-type small acid-soluble spore protein n=1 Tax=Paenibacillus TaxID=44249 RepID=UPI0004D726A6|nr:alpha/beta-type small acid-soluble spore protein [Paenibacillus sp. TCA20]GAK41273.1 small acid-soluble spore protein alpha/beta type [Paenibacillus sp. TCA20]
MARNKSKLVPECRQMLEQMKYEIAAEFGIYTGGSHAGGADTEFGDELGSTSGQSSFAGWGYLTSRENGSIGGEITKRLVRSAESSSFQIPNL